MRHMPTLAEVMTAFPLHIGENTRLTEAADLMAQHQCHHLPVMDGDEVIGLLGADDIKLAQQPGHNLDDSQELVVGDMCQRRVARVDLHTRLDVVLAYMADNGSSAVIVMRNERLAGLLTTHDVCRFTANWLHKEYMPSDDPDIA